MTQKKMHKYKYKKADKLAEAVSVLFVDSILQYYTVRYKKGDLAYTISDMENLYFYTVEVCERLCNIYILNEHRFSEEEITDALNTVNYALCSAPKMKNKLRCLIQQDTKRGNIEKRESVFWYCVTRMVAVIRGSAKHGNADLSDLRMIEAHHASLLYPLMIYHVRDNTEVGKRVFSVKAAERVKVSKIKQDDVTDTEVIEDGECGTKDADTM